MFKFKTARILMGSAALATSICGVSQATAAVVADSDVNPDDLVEQYSKEFGIEEVEVIKDDVTHKIYNKGQIQEQIDKKNETRQRLIKEAIRTGDWQEYRKFQFIDNPADFAIVNGKLEYSKTYYGKTIESTISWFNSSDVNIKKQRENSDAVKKQEDRLDQLIKDFKEAPGKIPYVIGLNHNREAAEKYGVKAFRDLKDSETVGFEDTKETVEFTSSRVEALSSATTATNVETVNNKELVTEVASIVSKVDNNEDEKDPYIPIEYRGLINAQEDGVGSDSMTETDVHRRADLEKEFDIKLSPEDKWENKSEVGSRYSGSEYTSVEKLKKLGIYGVNASRQELIQYGLRTGDWQPYRAFSAKRTPAYFEIVDGKYEYNKVYYGQSIESQIRLINEVRAYGAENMTNVADHVTPEMLEERLQEIIKDYNNAPGIVPYVIGFNSNKDVAKDYDTEMPSDDFFDSKWNGAMDTGKFREVKTETSNVASATAEDTDLVFTTSVSEDVESSDTITVE